MKINIGYTSPLALLGKIRHYTVINLHSWISQEMVHSKINCLPLKPFVFSVANSTHQKIIYDYILLVFIRTYKHGKQSCKTRFLTLLCKKTLKK